MLAWRVVCCSHQSDRRKLSQNFLSVKATCNTRSPRFRFGKFQSTSALPLSEAKFHRTPSFNA